MGIRSFKWTENVKLATRILKNGYIHEYTTPLLVISLLLNVFVPIAILHVSMIVVLVISNFAIAE